MLYVELETAPNVPHWGALKNAQKDEEKDAFEVAVGDPLGSAIKVAFQKKVKLRTHFMFHLKVY